MGTESGLTGSTFQGQDNPKCRCNHILACNDAHCNNIGRLHTSAGSILSEHARFLGRGSWSLPIFAHLSWEACRLFNVTNRTLLALSDIALHVKDSRLLCDCKNSRL